MPRITTAMNDDLHAQASRALKRIINDPNATAAHRATAREAIDRLNADYIDWVTKNLEKRTQAYQEVIDFLIAATAKLTKTPALAGAKKLQEIIGAAKVALGPIN